MNNGTGWKAMNSKTIEDAALDFSKKHIAEALSGMSREQCVLMYHYVEQEPKLLLDLITARLEPPPPTSWGYYER